MSHHITAQHHPLPQRITTKAEAVAAVEALFPKWDHAGKIVTDKFKAMCLKHDWSTRYEVSVHYEIDRMLQESITTFMWWALDKNTRLYKKARATFGALIVKRYIELTKANITAVERHYQELHDFEKKERAFFAQFFADGGGI